MVLDSCTCQPARASRHLMDDREANFGSTKRACIVHSTMRVLQQPPSRCLSESAQTSRPTWSCESEKMQSPIRKCWMVSNGSFLAGKVPLTLDACPRVPQFRHLSQNYFEHFFTPSPTTPVHQHLQHSSRCRRPIPSLLLRNRSSSSILLQRQLPLLLCKIVVLGLLL